MSSPDEPPPIPPDNHVHSEWSWDADAGSMEGACARAAELGLPGIAFTEHWDPTPCPMEPAAIPHLPPLIRDLVSPEDGIFRAPPLDVEGFVAQIERCRDRYPQLRILAGVELGEPHWWPGELANLLRRANFDRVLGSVHCVELDGRYVYVDGLYGRTKPHEVVRMYLAEVLRLVDSPAPFEVLAHIDYPVRTWPRTAPGAYQPGEFEDEYRAVLQALARSGRALEINTTIPLSDQVVRWWHESGGRAVSFGSDAHEPADVARGFVAAREVVRSLGLIDIAAGAWPRA